MFKKVIIPLDGSPLAEVAIPYAEELSTRIGANIIFLSVLPEDNPDDYASYINYIDGVLAISRQRILRICETQGDKLIEVDSVTRAGDPAQGILDYVSRGYKSLIIMATHGRSGLGRWAVGSVADRVVRSSLWQPLMLIRAKKNLPDVRNGGLFKKILVPVDGSFLSEAVFNAITPTVKRLKMALTLFKVVSKTATGSGAEDYLRDWCDRLREDGVEADYDIQVGSPAEQIIDYANEKTFDLVAMSTRGQTGVSPWPLGSVAQKVLLAGGTPLLLVKA